VLLVISTVDLITPPEGARKLFRELKVEKKEIRELKRTYQEIFEDPK